jgi:hypothetical protein
MILSWGNAVSSIAGLRILIGSCAQSDLFPGLDRATVACLHPSGACPVLLTARTVHLEATWPGHSA